ATTDFLRSGRVAADSLLDARRLWGAPAPATTIAYSADDEAQALRKLVPRWFAWYNAAFLFGAASGGLVFGWLGDRVGRVRAMAFSILVYSGFTGLVYFLTSPLQIAGLRFIAAIGMGGEWALGVALVMEVWEAKRR